ncbi:bystin, partial [Trifolium pratense]
EDFIYGQDAKLPGAIVPDDTLKQPGPDAESIFQLYKRVATILSKYTVGKFPDAALKHIPSMQNWEDVLSITEPHNWSPNAVYLANRIYVSNFGATKAERFYHLVLLPRVRQDIRQNNHLHFALYQSLQKALQKPTAFCKGILIPLCESRTCTLREAVIVGSIIEKGSIPFLHLCATLLKLAGMVYCGTIRFSHRVINSYDPRGFFHLSSRRRRREPRRQLVYVCSHCFLIFVHSSLTFNHLFHSNLCPH